MASPPSVADEYIFDKAIAFSSKLNLKTLYIDMILD